MKNELIILTEAGGNGEFTIANPLLKVYKINFDIAVKLIFYNIFSFIVQYCRLVIKKIYKNIKLSIKEIVDFWKLYYNNMNGIKLLVKK